MKEKDTLKAVHTNPQAAGLLLRELWQFDKKLYLTIGLAVLFSVLATAGAMVLPSLVISVLTTEQSRQTVIVWILTAFLVCGIAQALQSYLMSIESFMCIDFRAGHIWQRILKTAAECDYEYYEKEDSMILSQKAVNANGSNIVGVEGFFHGIIPFCAALLGLVVYAFLISFVSPLIVLLLFGLSAASYVAYLIMHRRSIRFRDQIDKEERRRYYFKELCFDVTLGKDIRLYQSHPLISRLYQEIYDRIRGLEGRRQNSLLAYEWVVEILSCARDAVCYGYLIYLMRNGSLSVAAFVLYLGVISGFSAYFQQITEKLAKINEDLSMAAFLFDWFDEAKPSGGETVVEEGTPDIVFDHVAYQYTGAEASTLKDFSLHIRPGETLALVGINGAGKTTLVKLLSGLYHPTSGKILVNGKDLETLDQSSWHRKIGVLFQDTACFSFTIGENISGCYEGTYDETRVMEAISRAGLKEKIDTLEKGIHTYIGKEFSEDGIRLSGGETQKMLLARAFYHEPELLILDEPTAALDAISEQELYLQYRNFIADKSAVFISHRLASTRFCDRIILIENGDIVEEGDHDTLMERKDRYYEMFEAQSKYYKEGGAQDEEDLI